MTRQRTAAIATAAFLGAAMLLASGLLSTETDGSGLYGSLPAWPDGGTPTECVLREGYTDSQTMGLFVPGYDGGAAYALVRVCVEATDGGEGEEVLPTEYAALPYVYAESQAVTPYTPGPVLEVWVQGHSGAPWACACAADETCTVAGQPAPLGVTLRPGTWAGACVRKPCSEFAGMTSWPEACP